jgi:hypothetical protein
MVLGLVKIIEWKGREGSVYRRTEIFLEIYY